MPSPIYPQPGEVSEHPHIRTFHARHGRMSARREFALGNLLPKFEVSELERPIDLSKVLGTKSSIVDFGSGMGDHALKLASENPQIGVLAIDVHTVGLIAIAEQAIDLALSNIRTHHGDGMEVFKDWLRPESIDEIHVLFPDPWPKARHHKRRLITESFLQMSCALLKSGGRMVFVTDDDSYYSSASEKFAASSMFELTYNDWDIPNTNYHRRALKLGNKISQLSAVRI